MRYFFVLGKNPALSVAELGAIFKLTDERLLAPDFLIGDSAVPVDPGRLMGQLGGTIKLGRIKAEIPRGESGALVKAVLDLAKEKQAGSPAGKFNFGFSDYGSSSFDKKNLGQHLKEYFNEKKISSRFVVSREKTLSSVVVAQNKLLSRGLEIILAADDNHYLIGETLAVQPFKDLSLRDYGRPARDDRSGMLPPKLAKIMINLAQIQPTDLILDPFCGSGTILTEAAVAGYQNLFGSDSSLKAIEDTRKNLSWVGELYKLNNFKFKLFTKKAEQLSKFIKSGSVDAIITEPYLGPQRGRIDFAAVTRELNDLYSVVIREFAKIIKPTGRVVMVWPLFYGERPLSPDFPGFRMLDMIPGGLRNNKFISHNKRSTIIYGRSGQKVYREVVVLEKING